MTPQQEVLNSDLPHTEEFQSLVEKVDNLSSGQQDIKATLKLELESQQEFKDEVLEEFNKGSRKFEKIESEMEAMKEDHRKGVKEIIDTINNQELNNLKDEIRATKEEKRSRKEFWMGVLKTVLSAIGAGVVLYGLSKIGLVKP